MAEGDLNKMLYICYFFIAVFLKMFRQMCKSFVTLNVKVHHCDLNITNVCVSYTSA